MVAPLLGRPAQPLPRHPTRGQCTVALGAWAQGIVTAAAVIQRQQRVPRAMWRWEAQLPALVQAAAHPQEPALVRAVTWRWWALLQLLQPQPLASLHGAGRALGPTQTPMGATGTSPRRFCRRACPSPRPRPPRPRSRQLLCHRSQRPSPLPCPRVRVRPPPRTFRPVP